MIYKPKCSQSVRNLVGLWLARNSRIGKPGIFMLGLFFIAQIFLERSSRGFTVYWLLSWGDPVCGGGLRESVAPFFDEAVAARRFLCWRDREAHRLSQPKSLPIKAWAKLQKEMRTTH